MPPTVNKPEGYESWRTVSELARHVGTSTRTVERWFSEGRLPEPFRTDRGVKLWSPEDCAKVLEERIRNLPSEKAKQRRIYK